MWSGGPWDVHAVWQAWAVSSMSWSSRKSRDRVCACEPLYYDDLSRSLIEKDKDIPAPPGSPPPPPPPPLPTPPHPTTTHPVLTAVALRHRSHTNVAFLSPPDLLKKKKHRERGEEEGVGNLKSCSRGSVSNSNALCCLARGDTRGRCETRGRGARASEWIKRHICITRTLLPIEQAHVISIYMIYIYVCIHIYIYIYIQRIASVVFLSSSIISVYVAPCSDDDKQQKRLCLVLQGKIQTSLPVICARMLYDCHLPPHAPPPASPHGSRVWCC